MAAAFASGANAFGGNAAMNQAMAGMVADQVGTHMNSMLMKWFPHLMQSARDYFNVNHKFVAKKLSFHVMPVVKLKTDSYQFNDSGVKVRELCDPDLYIPLMSFMTYVIVIGLKKGVDGNDFHPEYLNTCATFAIVLTLLEVVGAKVAFYICGYPQLPFLHLFSLAGAKFVNLVLHTVLTLLINAKLFQYLLVVVFGGSSAFGALQMLKALPDQAHGPLVAYAMMGFAGAQLPLFWILTS
jgi:hypothetical protein